MIRTDLTKAERQRLFDYYLKLAAAVGMDSEAQTTAAAQTSPVPKGAQAPNSLLVRRNSRHRAGSVL